MHKSLSRRTLLKAGGVALSLPLLESMAPAFGRGSDPAPPRRLAFVCTSLGLHPDSFWPETPGANYESTPYLDLLKDHREDFTLFGGLSHEDQTGRQPHDSEMTWLTAARNPGGAGFRNSISIDQYAAGRLGNVTRLPSATLGTIKSQSQSYTSGGVMIPAGTSPAELFAELFLDGKPDEVRRRRRELADGRSVLDELGGQRGRLRGTASAADNHLLDDYFAAVREAETAIAERQGWLDEPKPAVNADAPADIDDPADLIGRTRALLDLVPLMLQTDSTRVVSVMIQDHQAVRVGGLSDNHHNLSHHGRDPAKIEQLRKIEGGLMTAFGDFLAAMKSRREGGSSLLESTQTLFGSNLGNANAHDARNLPIILAGGGHDHGRYIERDGESPLCDLFVTMLNRAGVETDAFGQSRGALTW